MKRMLFVALAIALTGCAGNPQRLPVGVSICNAVETPQGFDIIATVENKSDRPITSMDMTTAFYQNFRYQSFSASSKLKQELDPGQKRDVTFQVASAGNARPRGQSIRCFVTHIGYMDGTSADAPASQ